MLFNSNTNRAVLEILQASSISANNARKAEAAKRLDYFHGEQLEHLQAQLKKLWAEPERLTPAFINIVKKITNILSMVYLQDAKREIDGSKTDQEIYAEIVESCGLGIKMKLASRYTKLLKTVLLRPVWRSGGLDLDVLTGNILDVETGDSPEDLQAVLVTHYGKSDKVEEVTYSLWTPDTFERLDYRGREIEVQDNPYNILPFVPCWDQAPTGEFWLEGGRDLIVLQEAISHKLTDLLYTIQQQGFGVGWVSGFKNSGNEFRGGEIKAGPGSLVSLPPDGKIGFAATEAPIAEILEAIDKLIKWAAVSNGLPAASLSTEPTEESGISKIVSNRELDELRRDDVALWAQYERRLFEVSRIVWNAHNPGRQISSNATLKIDFHDPRPALSGKEQADNWERLLELGIITQVDIALERNPDLKTRENALAHLLSLKDEQAQLDEKQI